MERGRVKEGLASVIYSFISWLSPKLLEDYLENSSLHKRNIEDLEKCRKDYNLLKTSYNDLEIKLQLMQESIQATENKPVSFEEEYKALKQDYENALLKYENLEKRHGELKGSLPLTIHLLEEAKTACLEVRTGFDVIEKRVEDNRSDTNSLLEWEQGKEKILYDKVQVAEERALNAEKKVENIERNCFRITMENFINADPAVRKVPFLYYDLINKKNVLYTPATLDFFGIKDRDFVANSLYRLLRKVDKKYLAGELGIINSIRLGEKLNHHEVYTAGSNPLQLRLTTYPVIYDNKVVGIGILLCDSLKNMGFISKLERVFSELPLKLGKIANDSIYQNTTVAPS
jgi:hypothetical protein